MNKELQLAKKQIKRILISREDILEAAVCAHQLLKHQYYKPDYLDRGDEFENTDEYINMKALTTTLVVAYSRPFTRNEGDNSAISTLPEKILKSFNSSEIDLHKKILNLRNKAFAHSDADLFDAHLSISEDGGMIFPVYMEIPTEFFLKKEIVLFQVMVEKYLDSFGEYIMKIFERYGHDAL